MIEFPDTVLGFLFLVSVVWIYYGVVGILLGSDSAKAKLPPDRYEFHDGKFDELWLRQASVHVERMDDGHIWAQFTTPDGRVYTMDIVPRVPTPLDVHEWRNRETE